MTIKLPLPPGQFIVFDHVAKKVYVTDWESWSSGRPRML